MSYLQKTSQFLQGIVFSIAIYNIAWFINTYTWDSAVDNFDPIVFFLSIIVSTLILIDRIFELYKFVEKHWSD